MNKQYNTGSGPGVPIISSVPRIPTPQYTMNIVNGLEIIAAPAKAFNNLNQVNNNTSNRPVYLDNGEKIQEESITHDFNKDNNSLDHLRERLHEGYEIIAEVISENGEAKVEVCRELLTDLEQIMIFIQEAVGIGRAADTEVLAPTVVPSIVQNEVARGTPNEIPSDYGGEMRMEIRRPCDYCSQYTYLSKIGKICSECERHKDLNYCTTECWYCQNNKKAYNAANNRVTTNQYVQVIKRQKVEEMLAIQPIQPIIEVTEKIVTPTRFNRNGNFEDKFLAVTYTLDDGDMTRDNVRYLVRQLEDNFMKLTQIKSMPCKGYIYVIEYTKALVPHLHGLVRMSGGELKRSISAKDNTFTGKNKIITKRPGDNGNREEKLKMLLKPINVEGWIAYMEKNYVIVGRTEIQGYMGKITEGWDYKEGQPMYPF